MIISKAITRLNNYLKYRKPDKDDNFHESTQLGVEALERLADIRKHPGAPVYGPLPSESMPERGIR